MQWEKVGHQGEPSTARQSPFHEKYIYPQNTKATRRRFPKNWLVGYNRGVDGNQAFAQKTNMQTNQMRRGCDCDLIPEVMQQIGKRCDESGRNQRRKIEKSKKEKCKEGVGGMP